MFLQIGKYTKQTLKYRLQTVKYSKQVLKYRLLEDRRPKLTAVRQAASDFGLQAFCVEIYRNFIQPGTWKEDAGDKSGVLYNLGAHMIDQVTVLFGMPKSVTTHLDILRDNGRAKDYYDIRLQYDGFAAILKSSYLVREPGPRYSLHGTLGSFRKWGIDPQEQVLKKRTPSKRRWLGLRTRK